METRKEAVLGAVARGWCSEKNSGKEMDIDLAEAITDEVMKIQLLGVSEKFDIEGKLQELYESTEAVELKMNILVTLHEIRLQVKEGEGAIK